MAGMAQLNMCPNVKTLFEKFNVRPTQVSDSVSGSVARGQILYLAESDERLLLWLGIVKSFSPVTP
jgi:hypothetical protein